MTDITEIRANDVRPLLASVNSYRREISGQRARLRSAWMSTTPTVRRCEQQLQAVDAEIAKRDGVLREISAQYGPPDIRRAPIVERPTIEGWFQPTAAGAWTMKANVASAFDADVAAARRLFHQASTKAFGGSLRQAAAESLALVALRISDLREIRSQLQGQLRAALTSRQALVTAERAQAERELTPFEALVRHATGRLPAVLQPWTSPVWEQWAAQPAVPGLDEVYAGVLVPLDDADLGDNADFGSAARIPYFVSLKKNLQIVYSTESRRQALSFARSILLRTIAAASPGELRLTFFDPVGLGQSAAICSTWPSMTPV